MTKKPTTTDHSQVERLREAAHELGVGASDERAAETLSKVAKAPTKSEVRRDQAESATIAAKADSESRLDAARTKTAKLKAQRIAKEASDEAEAARQAGKAPAPKARRPRSAK